MNTRHPSQADEQGDALPPRITIDPQGDSALRNKIFEASKVAGRDLTFLDLSAHEWTPDIEMRAAVEQ